MKFQKSLKQEQRKVMSKHAPLEILESTFNEHDISVPKSVVYNIHDIEMDYLFESNEDIPIKQIKKIVETAVDQQPKEN